jgi:hypothetical protein
MCQTAVITSDTLEDLLKSGAIVLSIEQRLGLARALGLVQALMDLHGIMTNVESIKSVATEVSYLLEEALHKPYE